jgi:hypothetical protein
MAGNRMHRQRPAALDDTGRREAGSPPTPTRVWGCALNPVAPMRCRLGRDGQRRQPTARDGLPVACFHTSCRSTNNVPLDLVKHREKENLLHRSHASCSISYSYRKSNIVTKQSQEETGSRSRVV